MSGDGDFAVIVSRILRRERLGHRLLLAYGAIAAVAVIAACFRWPLNAGVVVTVAAGAGCLLLVEVQALNRRARGPLRGRWPAEAQGRLKRPRAVWGIVFFLAALILIGAAGFVAGPAGNATGATAVVRVGVTHCGGDHCSAVWVIDGHLHQGVIGPVSGPDTQPGRYNPGNPAVVYVGPKSYFTGFSAVLGIGTLALAVLLALLYAWHRRRVRRPYLERLEQALSEAERGTVPSGRSAELKARLDAIGRTTAKDKLLVGLAWTVMVLRVALLVGIFVLGTILDHHGGSVNDFDVSGQRFNPPYSGPSYPAPTLARGTVTDPAAGLRYAAPGKGWTEAEGQFYPPYGAGFTAPVPRQPYDVAQIVSAPLPGDIRYTGPADLRDVAFYYAQDQLRDANYVNTTVGVPANRGFSVCGRRAWLEEILVSYAKVALPNHTTAIVVVDLGSGRRPGTLFADVPVTMDSGLVSRLVRSVRPVTGC